MGARTRWLGSCCRRSRPDEHTATGATSDGACALPCASGCARLGPRRGRDQRQPRALAGLHGHDRRAARRSSGRSSAPGEGGSRGAGLFFRHRRHCDGPRHDAHQRNADRCTGPADAREQRRYRRDGPGNHRRATGNPGHQRGKGRLVDAERGHLHAGWMGQRQARRRFGDGGKRLRLGTIDVERGPGGPGGRNRRAHIVDRQWSRVLHRRYRGRGTVPIQRGDGPQFQPATARPAL